MNNRWTFIYSYMWGVIAGLLNYGLTHNILASVTTGIIVGQIAWTINLRNASRMIASVIAKRTAG